MERPDGRGDRVLQSVGSRVATARAGRHIYVPNLAEKGRNQIQNFESDRLRVSQAIFRAV
jgi:hypothetical protein